MKNSFKLFALAFLFFCCESEISIDEITFGNTIPEGMKLTEYQLYDKVLGMLVGSAIGDAMGAPTEMWPRDQIQQEFGFVTSLDSMVREKSPEGTWKDDLPAGGTTDDTRWKILTYRFLGTQGSESLSAADFAQTINNQYLSYAEESKAIADSTSKEFERVQMQMAWLQEWYKVGSGFLKEDVQAYADSLGKFYGGEMVCAGLLYASGIGAYFPNQPEKAYKEAFKLSLYDIGYAKDITAMAASMTSAGMSPNATVDDLKANLESDPENYFDSRLVGRSANVWVREAHRIDSLSRTIDSLGVRLDPNSESLAFAFEQLDQKQQDMPFHAGEIMLQTLTAMFYADFDFIGTLTFLTNYGRDNDTTAALAGGILGAWIGFDALPEKEKELVIQVAKSELGQDLEKEAKLLTAHMLGK